MHFSKLPAMLFIGAIVSQPAVAAEYPLLFEEIDANADGYIDKEEAKVRKDLVKNFKKIDENKDDKLNLAEYQLYEGKEAYEPPQETETPELGAAPYPPPKVKD